MIYCLLKFCKKHMIPEFENLQKKPYNASTPYSLSFHAQVVSRVSMPSYGAIQAHWRHRSGCLLDSGKKTGVQSLIGL